MKYRQMTFEFKYPIDEYDEYNGYDSKRLDPYQNNPLELALNKSWKEENVSWGDLLQKLFPDMDITTRDKKMASTVIQWLGTNCGRGFLDRVRGNIKECRELTEEAQENFRFLERI